jgi:hypothetical protein
VGRDEVTTLGDQVDGDHGHVETMQIRKFNDEVDTGHLPGMLRGWEW